MTSSLLWGALFPLVLLSSAPLLASATDTSDGEKGVTFSHVYKIDLTGNSECTTENSGDHGEVLQTDSGTDGQKDVTFRHNIRLQTASCDCSESDSFKALLYRVNGLEEEVNYLKTQCGQGCCGTAGLDGGCSGHGTFQQSTCSCVCDAGWEGPDCSVSSCPNDCGDNGRCVDGRCVCNAGWGGLDCSSRSSCPDDCSDNGRCVDGRCVCNPGWEGPDCSISSCPDECNDNGRCVDGRCVCHQGFSGEDCSQAACPDNCSDKGRCVDGVCQCFPLFSGPDCSIQGCPDDCRGNGRCLDGRCVCQDGFYGDDCSMVLGPQGLRLKEVTEVSLLVEWESVKGAEYYLLSYQPKDRRAAKEQIRVSSTEMSYLISGLSPGVTYLVELQAVIREMQSKAEDLEATTGVSTVQEVRVVDQNQDSIQVDWKNPTEPVDYFRLTHTDPAGQEEQLQVQKSQEARTRTTIVGLDPGTEYQISVQAIRGRSEGQTSSVTGVTDLDAPTRLVTTEVSEDSATVSWQPVRAQIDGYMLSYVSSEGSSPDIPVGRDRSSYRLVGLRPGVLHTVYIWAYRGDRSSSKTSTEAQTELDSPKDLKAVDVSVDSASLSWIPPLADIEGYILTYRQEQGAGKTVEKKLGAAETSFQASGLQTGQTYLVTIIAYRGAQRSRVVETSFTTVGVQFPFPMDCFQSMKNGNRRSGVYTIYINGNRSRPAEVYCDMETDGGGWLVLQRRNSGRLDFMKKWRTYIAGFGDLKDEFWIGLEKIYDLTNTPQQYELRFDLGLGSEKAFAVYDNFKIAPVKQKFKLTIGKYRGNAGDAMTYHQGRPWTTVDNDNDIALGNCAMTHRGAWWYKNCHLANLNGKWGDSRHSLGVNWEPWKGHLTSLDSTEMKIRPVGASSNRRR